MNFNWRSWLIAVGRTWAVLIITTLSVAMSLLMLITFITALGLWEMEMMTPLIIAAVIPGVIAPIVSYFLMTLLCELEKTQQHLRVLAHRDSLTRTYNRLFFMDQLTLAIRTSQRTQKPLSLLMIDVDKFKSINDTFGHACGDEVLKYIAKICEKTLRPYDILARYGGEEFVVLLADTTSEIALTVAERIRSAIEQQKINVDHDNLSVTLSIGISTVSDPNANDAKMLLSRADSAMYRAKNSGRNRCVSG
jgi:diguanylate cyclase (GGDEF)-like protein